MHRRRFKGKKLGREKAPRKALMRSLATSLILYEKIDTTKVKAKETQRITEKLITEAKKGTLPAIKKLNGYLLHKNAAKKLIVELAPVYKDRKGGYTRVINLPPRVGDNASMARLELLDTDKISKTEKPKKEKIKEQKSKKDKTNKKRKEDKSKSGKNGDKESKEKISKEKDKARKTKTKAKVDKK